MSIPVLTFFNNKGGVGKTTLVYHLSVMMARLGLRVVAVDFDPQANLTSAFLEDDLVIRFWDGSLDRSTIYHAIYPLIQGKGDIASLETRIPDVLRDGDQMRLFDLDERLALIPGDLRLALFEQQLADEWANARNGQPKGMRVTSSLWRVAQQVAADFGADLIIVDVGPSLGAINRTVLLSADYVVFPLALDRFSLQGLTNIGPTLRRWKLEWANALHAFKANDESQNIDFVVPSGLMEPLGYVILQHTERRGRITDSYNTWAERILPVYRRDVLNMADVEELEPSPLIGRIRHYRSLMSMAHLVNKPIFDLAPVDGAIGSHMKTVQLAYEDFRELAMTLLDRMGIAIPEHM